MTHDPLCPNRANPNGTCFACIVIAQVRADERSKHANEYERGYDQAIRDQR